MLKVMVSKHLQYRQETSHDTSETDSGICSQGKAAHQIHQQWIPQNHSRWTFALPQQCNNFLSHCNSKKLIKKFRKHWYRWILFYLLSGKSATCVCFKSRFLQCWNISFAAGLALLNLDLLCWALRSIIDRSPDRHRGSKNQESTGGWQSAPSTNHEVPGT